MVNVTPQPFYPRERPGTHCTGGRMRSMPGLDISENLAPPGFDPRNVQPVGSRYTDWAHNVSFRHWWNMKEEEITSSALQCLTLVFGMKVQKTEINGRGDPLPWPRDILYPQKLALTSPTGGGRSVCIVHSRTKATDFFFFFGIKVCHQPDCTVLIFVSLSVCQYSWIAPEQTSTHRSVAVGVRLPCELMSSVDYEYESQLCIHAALTVCFVLFTFHRTQMPFHVIWLHTICARVSVFV